MTSIGTYQALEPSAPVDLDTDNEWIFVSCTAPDNAHLLRTVLMYLRDRANNMIGVFDGLRQLFSSGVLVLQDIDIALVALGFQPLEKSTLMNFFTSVGEMLKNTQSYVTLVSTIIMILETRLTTYSSTGLLV